MTDHKTRLAVFCSGTGSNFKALHRSIAEKKINAEFLICLSNRSTCGAIHYARENGIPAIQMAENQYSDYDSFTEAMLDALKIYRIEYIILAGYMRKVPDAVVDAYRERIVNIHPALLPKFGGEGMYGINVHKAVLAAGESESGATVHMVDEEYDRGRIVLQQKVPVLPGDTPETLALRVLACEHELYPRALRKILEEMNASDAP
ncbi:MAG: phosphoribosylglycinamide formyltransferase [Chlorobiaceae bacterium]|nr:phosphoribosylglycinamide formyltransferase [Chlorobiaceae bacterium]NTV59803.1 phosphoribosylglycinamide formyltransferase [Chlorobiaceae bacterium]